MPRATTTSAHSLVWFNATIDKSIKLIASYAEISELHFIIKACRLKPYELVIKEKKRLRKVLLHRRWFDEFGNTLIFEKKVPSLILNDIRMDRKKIVCTDLYYGLSIDCVAKMSNAVHLIAGKDEDLFQDCYLMTFLGIDRYLRSYLYWYGEWKQVSPLLMGWDNLMELAKNSSAIAYFRGLSLASETDIANQSALPCVSTSAWLSFIPISEDFINILRKQSCDEVADIFDLASIIWHPKTKNLKG